MDHPKKTTVRYLLGDLTDREQAALEEQYFADPRLSDELAQAETALIDDYVRGRLSAGERRRFEESYLADARRRERVRFAAALVARVDRAGSEPEGEAAGSGWWPSLRALLATKPALGFAVATLLIASTGIWLAIQSSRVRQQTALVDAERAEQTPESRTREAEAEQARARQKEGESARRADLQPTGTESSTAEPRAPSFIALAVAVGPGERAPDASAAPTLVIPRGIPDVRLLLRLREHEYPAYQVVVRRVGGPEVFRRRDMRPGAEGSVAVFVVSVPATRFTTGDYMVTLHGTASGGELDELSQSLFRVLVR